MNDEIRYQYFSSVLAIVNGFDIVRVCNAMSQCTDSMTMINYLEKMNVK